ncbi:hypothetical protein [Ruegeria atlantica]|uniref:Uncharacterized protein n=1 Tax=Ruegeria atlantica TaxID=81569 RepID=A0A0P1ESJ4_9RHOB|nr:hypothetical protein [Ruegeria atlantica]CUH46416.1 hypothetical protein RUA4292_00582 [Ruegeria atlantica]
MTLEELLKSDKTTQINWLKNKQPDTDLVEIFVRSWEEPLGCYYNTDATSFDDMVSYPDAYDLGWALQERIPEISDNRAISINDGAVLNAQEKSATRDIALEKEMESLGGSFCSGYFDTWNKDTQLFVAFEGPSLGQGGINYQFERIFRSKEAAIEHFKSKGDHWVDEYL